MLNLDNDGFRNLREAISRSEYGDIGFRETCICYGIETRGLHTKWKSGDVALKKLDAPGLSCNT
jgi:hypothetical protein